MNGSSTVLGEAAAWPKVSSDEQAVPDFGKRVCSIANFLPQAYFESIRNELLALAQSTEAVERTPAVFGAHKRGGTIAYSAIRKLAPCAREFYWSLELRQLVSDITGAPVVTAPHSDESGASILVYNKPRDKIGWHYDHNFYRGRHFTVLLAVENTGHSSDGLSAARLYAKIDGQDVYIPTYPNTLVVFEGAQVLHQATPIEENELRILLSMTFCSDWKNSIVKETMRRIKDVAFVGPRALWGGKKK